MEDLLFDEYYVDDPNYGASPEDDVLVVSNRKLQKKLIEYHSFESARKECQYHTLTKINGASQPTWVCKCSHPENCSESKSCTIFRCPRAAEFGINPSKMK